MNREPRSSQHDCNNSKEMILTLINALTQKIYGFIVLYVYVQSSAYSIIDTLVNPILSDQFGLGTGSISYFMLGVTILWSLSSMSV